MQTITYTQAGNKLNAIIQQVTTDHEPIRIAGQEEKRAILLSEMDYQGLTETLYLLSHPVNAKRLLQAVARPPEEATPWGQVKEELRL